MQPLSLLLWVPFFGAMVICLLPSEQTALVRRIALIAGGLALLLSVRLLASFDASLATVQLAESLPWSPRTGLSYALGVDGLSLPMVLLTTLLTLVALLASSSVTHSLKGYYAWMLVLEFAILGVFLARDWSLFFMFWELTLIPLFFLLDLWGGPKRHPASLNFVLYTMGGSIFILVGLIIIYRVTPAHSFDMTAMLEGAAALSRTQQVALLAAFIVGFGVKIPIFPLHGWLPLAHVEAPSPASILLSGVMLKMGAYGLIRVTGMFPEAIVVWQPWLAVLGMVNVLYGGLLAWRQSDLKAMVAYSSISHMGVVVLGIATLNVSGLLGATTQMVAHGLSAGALFLMVGLLYERTHSREVTTYAALVKVMPGFTIFMTIALLASIGMPGSAGFVAELHTLVGGFERWGWPIGLVSAGVLVGAAYAVRTVGHLFTGPARAELTGLRDLQGHEIAAALPLALGLVVLGLQPALITRLLEATITALAGAF